MLCVPVKGTSGAEASYERWGGVLQEEDTTPDCMKALEALMKYVHLHITRDAGWSLTAWRMHYVIHCTVHATYSLVHGTACCQPMMCGAVWSILDSRV